MRQPSPSTAPARLARLPSAGPVWPAAHGAAATPALAKCGREGRDHPTRRGRGPGMGAAPGAGVAPAPCAGALPPWSSHGHLLFMDSEKEDKDEKEEGEGKDRVRVYLPSR